MPDDDLLEICDMPGLKIPEIKLWAACLKRSIRDLRKNPRNKSALLWISDDDGTFAMLCEVLGTDPDYIRHKIRKLLKNP